ncbi:Hypothetical predicted protein [Paramuricea clavata]|uniref:Uncharacterized protein n=1 Tax=Paramuricea clavata TaxID=317549 RepID=A0A6S7J362_PARCT|nr:Hypothetical predicted protein [Paramuricea clavata]
MKNVILFYPGTDGIYRGVPMKRQAVYTVCVILELFVFLAGSTNVEYESGSKIEFVAKRSSEPSTWACHAGCKKFCLPSCKRSCCAAGAQPYHEGMFKDLLNYQDTLPPPPPPPAIPAGMPGPSAAGQCAQGCPQSCAPSCQPQCCAGRQMGAPGMQPNPYQQQQQQQQPYGYPQQGYPQQQTGRNYQTGLASPSSTRYGQSYAQGLAGNAAYHDENDLYNVHIPSAFERLKAMRKPSPRYKPVAKAKPKSKASCLLFLFNLDCILFIP